MKRMLIRYKTKPEATVQNRSLIENVFAELKAKSPAGLRYMSMMLADGSFVHVVEHADGYENPLPLLEAFRAFQAGIRERCEELPVVNEATIVGNYRMLDE
jgi:hypothetical protein